MAGTAGSLGMAGMSAAGQAGAPVTNGGSGTTLAGASTGGEAGSTLSGGAGSGGVGGVTGAVQAGAGGAGGQGGSPPVLEPGIRWLGRVAKTATGARFSWPGTGFTARWNGTAAKVSMKTDQADFLQIVVDDKITLLSTQSGQHDYDLAQGLTAGDHTVTLWRRTEANHGSMEVTKLDLQGGTLLSPPPPPNKRLEIVGDSITVGFGVECKAIDEAFMYSTENNYQTYEAIAARDLGAEVHTQAWSGIGMWRDVNGGMQNEMPTLYLRTLGNEDAGKWDFASYVPTAVVILLGTNDFAKGDPAQPFVDAYKTFVNEMRGRYPLARIYLAHSPMLSGDRGTALAGYLDQVVAARSALGDKNIGILDFKPPAQDAWGCGHPNGATHKIMADVLEAALKQDLGW